MALSRDRPEPLLVVHGLEDRALAWRRFAAAMAPGREVVLFPMLVDDQRENGRRYWEELGGIRVSTLVVSAGASFGDAGQLEENRGGDSRRAAAHS